MNLEQQSVPKFGVVKDAVWGNVECVYTWLENNGRNKSFHIILSRMFLTAAETGQDKICELIINSDIINFRYLIPVALTYACRSGSLNRAALLFKNLGGTRDNTMMREMLALALLNMSKTNDVVNWLTHDVLETSPADAKKWNLLLSSALDNINDVMEVAQTIDCDISVTMSEALWIACYRGSVSVANWLLTHTAADINHAGVMGIYPKMTSLAIACKQGNIDVAMQLLRDEKTSCDVNMANIRLNTALHFAICSTGSTALHDECKQGNSAKVETLIYDVCVNMQDSEGLVPLHYAAGYGHWEVAKMLLAVFAATEATDRDNTLTPIQVCELYGNHEMALYFQQLMYYSTEVGHKVATSKDIADDVKLQTIYSKINRVIQAHKEGKLVGEFLLRNSDYEYDVTVPVLQTVAADATMLKRISDSIIPFLDSTLSYVNISEGF
jgi:ankyrin repeat protein